MMFLHVTRRELAARWILLPAAIAIGAVAMAAIRSIGHVRGDADSIMNGTWVGTLVISTVVGMSLLGDELTNSRLSFYFARPFTPRAIFGGKLVAGLLIALLVQLAIVFLVALALPELSWRGSALAQRDILSVGAERVFATVGCILLGIAASIALGSKTRWFVVDALGLATVGVLATWFTLRLEPDPAWLPDDSTRSAGEKALFHAASYAIAAIGLGVATARALVQGRTDRMRAHRTLSTTLWPIVIPAVLAVTLVGEQTRPKIPDAPVHEPLALPTVTTASVLASEQVPVPYLIVPAAGEAVHVGAAASWAKVDAWRLRLTNPGPLNIGDRFLRYRFADGTSGELAVASISLLDTELVRWSSSQKVSAQPSHVAVRVAEKPGGVAPWEVARQLELEQERVKGILGLTIDRHGLGYPRRHAILRGVAREDRMLEPNRPMVSAPPSFRAVSLIRLIATTGGSIAVSHAGRLRPLGIDFAARDFYGSDGFSSSEDWIEVRVVKSRIVVEAVPGAEVVVASSGDLAAAISNTRQQRYAPDRQAPIDVLIDESVDSQQLVAILAALVASGVREIGVGVLPAAADLALRGHRVPSTILRDVCRPYEHSWLWDVDLNKINACYDAVLVGQPDLSGLVTMTAVVERDGQVTTLSVSGDDSTFADCITTAMKELEIPPRNRDYLREGAHELELELRP